jgi:hypothetical protein
MATVADLGDRLPDELAAAVVCRYVWLSNHQLLIAGQDLSGKIEKLEQDYFEYGGFSEVYRGKCNDHSVYKGNVRRNP